MTFPCFDVVVRAHLARAPPEYHSKVGASGRRRQFAALQYLAGRPVFIAKARVSKNRLLRCKSFRAKPLDDLIKLIQAIQHMKFIK